MFRNVQVCESGLVEMHTYNRYVAREAEVILPQNDALVMSLETVERIWRAGDWSVFDPLPGESFISPDDDEDRIVDEVIGPENGGWRIRSGCRWPSWVAPR